MGSWFHKWCGLNCFENPTSGFSKGLDRWTSILHQHKSKFFLIELKVQSYMGAPLSLCVKSSSQSQPGLFSTFGPVAPNTPELATSEIGFHIRTAPFQFWPTEAHFTSLCRKHKEKPRISPVMCTISATHQHHQGLTALQQGSESLPCNALLHH